RQRVWYLLLLRLLNPLLGPGATAEERFEGVAPDELAGRANAREHQGLEPLADRCHHEAGSLVLKLLRGTGLEMNEIRLSGPERGLHRLGGTRIDDLDSRPVRSLVARRPAKHDQR